jgi:hypothetical protein
MYNRPIKCIIVVILSFVLVTSVSFSSSINNFNVLIPYAEAKGSHHQQGGSNNGGGQQSGSNSGGGGSGTTITDNFQAGGSSGSNTPVGPVNVGSDNNNNQGSSTHKSKHSHVNYPLGCGFGFDNKTCDTTNQQSRSPQTGLTNLAPNTPAQTPTLQNNNGNGGQSSTTTPNSGSNTGTGGQNQQGITNLPPPGTLGTTPSGQQQTPAPTGTTSTTGSGNNNNNCGPIMKSRGSLSPFMNPCLGQATPLTGGSTSNTNSPSSPAVNPLIPVPYNLQSVAGHGAHVKFYSEPDSLKHGRYISGIYIPRAYEPEITSAEVKSLFFHSGEAVAVGGVGGAVIGLGAASVTGLLEPGAGLAAAGLAVGGVILGAVVFGGLVYAIFK